MVFLTRHCPQYPGLHVDVLPAQVKQFLLPQTGIDSAPYQGLEVVGHFGQQTHHLLALQQPWWVRLLGEVLVGGI